MRCMLFLLLKGVLAAPIDPSLNVDDLQGGIADFSALSTILGAEMVADATASGYRRPFMIAGVPWSVIGYIGFVKHVITAALGQKILKRLGFEGEDVALLTKGGFEDIVRAEFESTSIGQLTATINCIHRETQKGWDDSQSWWCISTIFEGWYQAIDSDLSMMLELDQYNKLRARQIRNVALNITLGSLGVLATVLSTTFLVFTGDALYLSILLIIGGITSHVWVVLTYNPIIAALDKCSVEQIVLRVAVFNNKGSQLRTWNITLPENMAKAMLKNRPNQAGPDSISANNINSVLPFLDNDYLISHMLKRAGVREMEEYRQWEMSGENLVDLERLEIEPTDSRIRKDIPYNLGKCTLKNLEVLEAMQKDGEKWSVQRTYDNIR
ncbi:hypothetical protein BGZ58_000084 [Dissophora ornata]|nr:hypothetical protein BGZ58_000084 [Dissophora ornata]